MTETASTICSNLPGARQRKPGSVGIPIGAEIRIAVGPSSLGGSDGVGEILLRGPSVITNYASGESGADYFDDGWLRSGDVGRIDEDGFLYVIGRCKELIKRGFGPYFYLYLPKMEHYLEARLWNNIFLFS